MRSSNNSKFLYATVLFFVVYMFHANWFFTPRTANLASSHHRHASTDNAPSTTFLQNLPLARKDESLHSEHFPPVPLSPPLPEPVPVEGCQDPSTLDAEDSECVDLTDAGLSVPLSSLAAQHVNFSLFYPAFWQRARKERDRVRGLWHHRTKSGLWDYGPPSWAGIPGGKAGCFANTPECSFFLLPEIYSAKLFRKCCHEHGRLRVLLEWSVKVATAANITMFMGFGNLLGILRHSGTSIPWDTDIDILVPSAQAELLHSTFKEAAREGPHAWTKDKSSKARQMYAIYWKKTVNLFDVHVEFWLWRNGNIDDKNAQSSRRHVAEDLIYPLRPCKLWGLDVQCPREGARILEVRICSVFDGYVDL